MPFQKGTEDPQNNPPCQQTSSKFEPSFLIHRNTPMTSQKTPLWLPIHSQREKNSSPQKCLMIIVTSPSWMSWGKAM